MAVTSLLTSLEDFESTPTYNDIGTGNGASDNTDVFIEGSQSGGRRIDNASDKGFMATISSTDLSAADEHIKLWVFCFHWSSVTALHARFASGSTAYDNHDYAVADLPVMGGFLPLWVDISRTPDSTGTSGLDESAVIDIGAYITIGNVGGSGDNFIIDEIMHGTSGYRWDGSSGSFDDFETYEVSNVEGVLVRHLDALLCFARLEVGSSTATTFDSSGFTITFPDQALVSTTFMGLTFDLQNASTAITLSNGALVSGDPTGATNKFDLLASSTSGTLDMDTILINGARTIELNSACSLTNSTILNTGLVDLTNAGSNGADLTGTTIADSTVAADASACVWDVNADPDGEMDNMTFVKGTAAHHAIELGTNSPLTVTFRGTTSSGFNASDSQNDSFFYVARTSGSVTINVVGGSGNFSYKSAGASVSVVIDPVTVKVTCKTRTGSNIQSVRVLLEAADGTGPLPFELNVTSLTQTSGTATATTASAHNLQTNDYVVMRGASPQGYNGPVQVTVTGGSTFTYSVDSGLSSPATGTIEVTGAALYGVTDVNGEVSTSRTYSSDQPVDGKAAKSTASPLYKDSPITGIVDSVNGLDQNVVMVSDE